jgi:hypothetical protein
MLKDNYIPGAYLPLRIALLAKRGRGGLFVLPAPVIAFLLALSLFVAASPCIVALTW